jgi:phenylacetate-CoA ligase
VILDKAEEMGFALKFSQGGRLGRRAVPLAAQGLCRPGDRHAAMLCHRRSGLIAYESPAMEGMIVDEGVIVEIVRPGTGDPVPDGEVGEVVVTTLNPDYPLIRFATGDLSAVLPGRSPCGRTNMRIKGWMGRADQTTKIKGMFVRPEQVAELVARHRDVARARVVATRDGEMDVMTVQLETEARCGAFERSVAEVLKLKGRVELLSHGSLPNDGKVIDDRRVYD